MHSIIPKLERFKMQLLLAGLLASPIKSFSPGFSNSILRTKTHHKEFLSTRTTTTSIHGKKHKPSWGVGDDWGNLSINGGENSSFDSSSIFNVDAATVAARDLEKWMSNNDDQENEDSDDKDTNIDDEKADKNSSLSSRMSKQDDEFIHNAIDTIQSESLDPNGPALYDTFDSSSFEDYTKSVSFTDELGKEISLLVRCNESPHEILVETGRALPELNDEDKYDVSQLVTHQKQQKSTGTAAAVGSEFEPTEFLVNSVREMFMQHAKAIKKDENCNQMVLDYAGVASWLSKSLGWKVSQHDKLVPVVMSKHATYGSGVLTEDQFMNIYMDAVTIGLDSANKQKERKSLQMLKRMKLNQANLKDVWRDLQNHGISPPIVSIREELQAKIDAEHGNKNTGSKMEMMDECEILEWGNDAHSTLRTSTNSKMEGATSDTKRSSHEFIELSSDHKTPKRLRDGEFIFIDEESCIGCYQCANIAPSSFKIVDSGRARTFHQSNSPDVSIAVSACPVSCMHKVAFHELKEMETARDVGDGHAHHRHMNKGHTPLHIARRGSDLNHKSSWYHYLKQKCFTSKTCPQRGCYDCPNYAKPGDNPNFKKLHAAAEKIRANDIIDSGEGDIWRKIADL